MSGLFANATQAPAHQGCQFFFVGLMFGGFPLRAPLLHKFKDVILLQPEMIVNRFLCDVRVGIE